MTHRAPSPPSTPPTTHNSIDPGSLADMALRANAEDEGEQQLDELNPVIEDIKISIKFVNALKNASLDSEHERLDPDVLDRLRKPEGSCLVVDDPDLRLSLDLFLSVTTASEDTYSSARTAFLRRHPDDEILSYYQVKRLVEDLSGIIPIIHDMCINSCVGYTGPFAELECCPHCGQSRYETKHGKKVSRKQFSTFPIGPQLQALFRSEDGARSMRYRREYTAKILEELTRNKGQRTSPYTDFFDGSDYIEAVLRKKIADGDIVLVYSIDGAQLYRNRASDCWLYIWIVLDLPPNMRYKKKHILPGAVIPGPQKPKNLDSFIFPGSTLR